MPANKEILALVADIVSAYVSNNHGSQDDISSLIQETYSVLNGISGLGDQVPIGKPAPAVSVHKSLANPSYILSMIDGKPYAMLKRHLGRNGLTPAEYRKRYDLPSDYPMTSMTYSERRREIARSIGFAPRDVEAGASAPGASTAPKHTLRARKADAGV